MKDNYIKININAYVKVKLTKYGIEELERQHNELKKQFPNLKEFTPPETEGDGYSKFQLWALMRDLGHMLILGSDTLPFHTNILIIHTDK